LRIPSQQISQLTTQQFFSQLPLENWADLLPFVPRHQLVEIVKQLNDRQFAKILQFFLTEVGQIALGHLRIVGPRFGPWQNDPSGYGGPIVEVRKEMLPLQRPDTWDVWPPSPSDLETNLPEGPIPANVKGFKLIELRFAVKLYLTLKECTLTLYTGAGRIDFVFSDGNGHQSI
jgi:hypothetical protein